MQGIKLNRQGMSCALLLWGGGNVSLWQRLQGWDAQLGGASSSFD